jgi:hypothetical protein
VPRWRWMVAAVTSLAASLTLGSAAPSDMPSGDGLTLVTWRSDRDRHPSPIRIRVSPTGKLYPGARRALGLSLANPNPFAIKVRTIRGRVVSTSKRGCTPGATNLMVLPYRGRLPLAVAAGSRRDAGQLEIFMPNSVVDACQGARFVIHIDADATRAGR